MEGYESGEGFPTPTRRLEKGGKAIVMPHFFFAIFDEIL